MIVSLHHKNKPCIGHSSKIQVLQVCKRSSIFECVPQSLIFSHPLVTDFSCRIVTWCHRHVEEFLYLHVCVAVHQPLKCAENCGVCGNYSTT